MEYFDFIMEFSTTEEMEEALQNVDINHIFSLFPNALNNYTDQICEKQIRICVETIENHYQAAWDSLGITELSLEMMPHDFEQPKIDDLLTKK